MSYTHYLVARIDSGGATTYLNVLGSWHKHPAEATPFFSSEFARTAAMYVQPGMHKDRLEVMKVSSVCTPEGRNDSPLKAVLSGSSYMPPEYLSLDIPENRKRIKKSVLEEYQKTDSMIQAIKTFRELTGLGLYDAKDQVEKWIGR